ncbi:hypothetical protein CYMTET_37500 [Cymbomonas tetramitiformis]|uniref:Uncharacterized protein n=1 Tax=Cymbomonas tetramitiformis TaxID=36881 RepID=A0AAE0CDX3_9CHLO|nr:hypothetical protein CYMTET_37500 [Cymbomonas tetramitiformis]
MRENQNKGRQSLLMNMETGRGSVSIVSPLAQQYFLEKQETASSTTASSNQPASADAAASSTPAGLSIKTIGSKKEKKISSRFSLSTAPATRAALSVFTAPAHPAAAVVDTASLVPPLTSSDTSSVTSPSNHNPQSIGEAEPTNELEQAMWKRRKKQQTTASTQSFFNPLHDRQQDSRSKF